MADDSRIAGARWTPIVEPQHLWYVTLAGLSIAAAFGLVFAGPFIVFGLVAVVFLTIMLLHNPFLGVVAYIVFEYARLAAAYPGLRSLQFGKLIVAATLLMFLVRHVVMKENKLVTDRIFLIFGAWLALAAASIAFAMNSQMATDATIDLAKWFVICYLIINLVDSLPKFQIFVWILLLLNLKLAQFQIRSFLTGYAAASNQAYFIREGIGSGSGGYFANGNDFGLAMVIVAPLAFYLILSLKKGFTKLIAGGFTATFVIALLRSGSRGAALGLAAAAVLFWARSKSKFVSFALVLAFLGGFWAMAPDPWKERFISAKNYDEDATASSRITLWKAGIAMFKDHPLTGVGIDNYSPNWLAKYNTTGVGGASVVHNIFIQAASELGICGLIILIAVLVMVFRRNGETRRILREANLQERWLFNFSLALDCALLGFIVHGFFLTVLYYPHLYIITAMAIALNSIAKKSVLQASSAAVVPAT
jgi:putative inorganic carbon (hco3(-)) transporter